MTTNTTTDQVGTVITTEFGSSPLSFPKGVANVAPYVYGASRTYAGVTAPDSAEAPVVEETAASPEPVEETVEAPADEAPADTTVASDVESEVQKVEAEAEKVAEDIKDEVEKVVTDVEKAV